MDRLYPASLIILPHVVAATLFVLAPVFAVIVLDVMLPCRTDVSSRGAARRARRSIPWP